MREGDFGVFSLFFWISELDLLVFSDFQNFLSKTPFSPTLTYPASPTLSFITNLILYKYNIETHG